jgi:hypothetical protein
VSELFVRLREILAALTASDPTFKRFGAAQHHYELMPPVTEIELSHIDERLGLPLPEDYLDYISRLSAGGVGPYYGLIAVQRAAAYPVAAPAGVTAWKRALAVTHLGCGYAAVMPLDGQAAGQIWIDARALQLVAPIRPSFTAFLLDWVDKLAHAEWLDPFVPPGRCAIMTALSGYLGICEQRLGLAPGSLDGPALRDALADLGPGAIEVTAEETALFRTGDRVDPCVACARALQGLEDQGLRHDVLARGVPPLPSRE